MSSIYGEEACFYNWSPDGFRLQGDFLLTKPPTSSLIDEFECLKCSVTPKRQLVSPMSACLSNEWIPRCEWGTAGCCAEQCCVPSCQNASVLFHVHEGNAMKKLKFPVEAQQTLKRSEDVRIYERNVKGTQTSIFDSCYLFILVIYIYTVYLRI